MLRLSFDRLNHRLIYDFQLTRIPQNPTNQERWFLDFIYPGKCDDIISVENKDSSTPRIIRQIPKFIYLEGMAAYTAKYFRERGFQVTIDKS